MKETTRMMLTVATVTTTELRKYVQKSFLKTSA